MTKAIARSLSLAFGLALALGTLYARPAPAAPGDGDAGAGAGAGSGSGSGTTSTAAKSEKAGTDESLQNGGHDRPWARGVTDAQQRAALVAFHRANLELNNGLFAKAADSYQAALKHWDHPAIHYNLALALMAVDQPIAAYDNLQAAIKYGTAPLQSKDKFDNAKRYMALLDKQIAVVEVTCNKPGAKVSVDGKPVFVGPGTYKGRVRAGRHTFVAELEGHPTRLDAPYISPGAPFRIELTLYTVEELTRYRRRWNATWMPYAVAGGGVLVGLIGGALEMSAQSSFHDFDAQVAKCNSASSGAGCTVSQDLVDMRDQGNLKRTLGYVGYGLAAGAIVTGAVLAYVNRRTPYQITADDLDREHTEAKDQPAVSFAPMVGPQGAGAMVFGHF